MTTQTVDLLKHQMEFLTSKEKFAVLSGGIGSGKSHAFRVALLSRAIEMHPNDLGLLTAGTTDQLRDTVLEPLTMWLAELGIAHNYNRQTRILRIGHARFLCTGLDNPSPLRGIEVGCIFGDEAAFYKEESLDIILGRLRNKYAARDYGLIARFATSPNGKNHFYDKFIGPDCAIDAHVIKAKIRDNIYLPPDYIDSLYRAYNSKQALQELEGEYIEMGAGNVYWAFSEKNVINVKMPRDAQIFVGMDFNVDPMTAVAGYVRDNKIYITNEFYLENSNTFRMASRVWNNFQSYETIPTIYPDSSGAQRKTSAIDSDHQILRDQGFLVKSSSYNPRKEDRYNTVNKLLEDGRLFIDKSCVKLQRDLVQVVYEKNSKELTHISDALGYLAYGLFPLKRPRKASSTIVFD